jgi:hypothetical protein
LLEIGAIMKARTMICASLVFVLAGCSIAQIGSVIHPTVSGSLTVRRADGTELHWSPDHCQSGAVEYFVGFDFLSSSNNSQLRALQDPINGPVVRWKSGPKDAPHTDILRHADCGKLDLDVQPTEFRVNDVREFAGHVELQCVAADGTRIEGRIDVDHCNY